MPVTYPGNGTIPSTTSGAGRIVPIQAVTETGSGLVVQATGHGFNEGDTVEIEQGGAADGVYTIHVQDANDFLLNDTIGVVYASGAVGYCIDYQVLPAVSLPANGSDLVDATVAGAVWEAEQNFQPWMYRLSGKYRIYGSYGGAVAGSPSGYPFDGASGGAVQLTGWSSAETESTNHSLVQMQGSSTSTSPSGTSGGGSTTFVSMSVLQFGSSVSYFAQVHPTDILDITYEGSVQTWLNANNAVVLELSLSNNGAFARANGSGKLFVARATREINAAPFTIRGRVTGAQLATGGLNLAQDIFIGLAMGEAISVSVDTPSVYLVGPAQINVMHYRAN